MPLLIAITLVIAMIAEIIYSMISIKDLYDRLDKASFERLELKRILARIESEVNREAIKICELKTIIKNMEENKK